MKTVPFILFALSLSFLQYACQDPCKDINCQNGGICISGTCDCPDGYLGQKCEVKIDPCEIQRCVNADTCVLNFRGEPLCICSDGFEGERCDSSWADKFIGRFDVTESCNSSNFFEVEIVSGPRFNEFTVINFHDKQSQGESRVVVETVNSASLNIRQQFMEFGEVSGIGSLLTSQKFTLDYSVILNGDTLVCGAVLERKF